MTVLEILLTALSAVLAILLVVALSLLGGARRRIRTLRRRLEEGRRPRRRRLSIPTASQAVRGVVGTAIRVKDEGLSGAFRGSIADLARWADIERPDLVRLADLSGSVTLVFSDIQDSTATNERLGDRAWVRLLTRHDRLVTNAVKKHDGYVVKSQGDGFMIAFGSADAAVQASLDIQEQIEKAGSRLEDVLVRIGAHTGTTVHRDNDLFGRNVAYAARVAAMASGGEVLVSDDTLEQLSATEAQVTESFEVDLKGFPGKQWVHRVEPLSD